MSLKWKQVFLSLLTSLLPLAIFLAITQNATQEVREVNAAKLQRWSPEIGQWYKVETT
ncbi:MAG: hypothetical protein ACE5ER_08760 [Nitrospinaceae bacterium]